MNNRVIEVNPNGSIVWSLIGLSFPSEVQRLNDGNTLVTEMGIVREYDFWGNIVWSYEGAMEPGRAERLPNGNTLLVDKIIGGVYEVNFAGDIIWSYPASNPSDADRLPNGNTLISQVFYPDGKVIEVTPSKNIVWQINTTTIYLYLPREVDRLNNGNTLIATGSGNSVIEIDNSGNILWYTGTIIGGIQCFEVNETDRVY